MRVETTSEPQTFLDTASKFLLADPVVNSVLLSVATNLVDRRAVDGAEPIWAMVRDGGEIVAVTMRTPPRGIMVSRLPGGTADLLADALLPAHADASSLSGVTPGIEGFVDAWTKRTGTSSRLGMAQRIFRLDSVVPPAPTAGRWRLARAAERELLGHWSVAFEAHAHPDGVAPAAPSEQTRRHVDQRIAEGRAHLWDVDGEPVCYVGTSPLLGGNVKIGPVFTPPEKRNRGFASALTAAATQWALDNGATTCSLYTDLANPTSNKIYQALGYRPVCDSMIYTVG